MFELYMDLGAWRPIMAPLFGIAMFVTAVFLMLLVLVQRGRGGGLAGALGGAGGQSAFGAKAGDTFTKVTIYASTFWILLCVAALVILNPAPPSTAAPAPSISNPANTTPGETDGASGSETSTEGGSETSTEGGSEANTEDSPETNTEGNSEASTEDSPETSTEGGASPLAGGEASQP